MTTKQKELHQTPQKKQACETRIWYLTLWGKTPTAIPGLSLKRIAQEILMSPGVRAASLYDEACVCISCTRRTIVTFEKTSVTFGTADENAAHPQPPNRNQECKKKALLSQDRGDSETREMLTKIAFQKVSGTGQSVLVTPETLFVEDQTGPLQVLVVVLRERPPEPIKCNPRHIVPAGQQGWTWSPVARHQEHRLFKTIGESLGRGDVVSIQGQELTILILETNPFFGREDAPETKQTIAALKTHSTQDKHYEARLKCVLETARMRSYRDRFFMPVITQGLVWFLAWLHTSLAITETSIDGSKVEFRSRRPLCYVWVGESQIGKSFLIQTLVKPLGFKYHRGNIDWMTWEPSIGHVIDDLSNADTTTLAALKTIINSTDEGDVRRPYGYSHISPAVTVLLLNAEAFVVLRQECAKQGMLKWMEENSIVFPPETHWAVCVEDKDTASDPPSAPPCAWNAAAMQSMNPLCQGSGIPSMTCPTPSCGIQAMPHSAPSAAMQLMSNAHNPSPQWPISSPAQSALIAQMPPPAQSAGISHMASVTQLSGSSQICAQGVSSSPSQGPREANKGGCEQADKGGCEQADKGGCEQDDKGSDKGVVEQEDPQGLNSCAGLLSKCDCPQDLCDKRDSDKEAASRPQCNPRAMDLEETPQQGGDSHCLSQTQRNPTRGLERPRHRIVVVDKEPDEWYSDTQVLYDVHRETTQAMFEATLKDLSMCVETHVLEKLKQEGMPAIIPKSMYLDIARHVVEHVENVMERTILEDPDLSCESESEFSPSAGSQSKREEWPADKERHMRRVLSCSSSKSPSLVEREDLIPSCSQTEEWDLWSREDVWEDDVPPSKRAIDAE